MSNIQLIVFDIAGTTVKDKGNVAIAFIEAFKEFNISVPYHEVGKVMGFRKRDAIGILLAKVQVTPAGDNHELIEKIHDAFTRNMITSYENDAELMPTPYAEQLFGMLKQWGIRIALNTGFTRSVTDTILKRLQWHQSPLIDFVVCSDEVPYGRPQPYMIQSIMQQTGISDSKSVVKVGDTTVDVEEGRNAGCGLVISVTSGAATRAELESAKPDRIIDSLEELPALI